MLMQLTANLHLVLIWGYLWGRSDYEPLCGITWLLQEQRSEFCTLYFDTEVTKENNQIAYGLTHKDKRLYKMSFSGGYPGSSGLTSDAGQLFCVHLQAAKLCPLSTDIGRDIVVVLVTYHNIYRDWGGRQTDRQTDRETDTQRDKRERERERENIKTDIESETGKYFHIRKLVQNRLWALFLEGFQAYL